MMVVGTMKKNCKLIADLNRMEDRERERERERESQSTKLYFEKDKGAITIISFVVNTKLSGKHFRRNER